MKVITIAHQKGGVGKTTLAINLAYCFATQDVKVAIVDVDLQGSVSNLRRFLTGVDIVSVDDLLSGNLTGYELVVVDTPPYLSNRLTELFELSDYVLVPTKAGIMDVIAINATIALLQKTMETSPKLKAGIVLNMVLPRTSLNEEIKAILNEYAIPVHSVTISQRVSYTRSPLTGSVFGSDDQRAKNEIVNLVGEIFERIV